jgi:Family of unknown function (DUF6049)
MSRALGSVLVLIAAIALPQRANAQQPAPGQSRSDILQLVSQTPVVEPDSDLTIRLRVAGAPVGAQIHVEVHSRVPTRSDFKAALAGKGVRARITAPIVVPAVPDASGVVVVTVPTHDVQTEGVYPVTVDLLSDKGSALDSLLTFLVRMPVSREFGPLGVAIVLPVGGHPALRTDGTSALDPATAQAVLSESSVLEAHAALPVTIPAIGETLDALDAATADELRSAAPGRQFTLTPYVNVHPAEWLTAGISSELNQQFDRGVSTITRTVGAPDTTTYIADDHLTTEAARALRDRGVRSMVVPENGLAPLDERLFNRTLTQPFNLTSVDGVQAAVADASLSAHAGETGDPVLDANHLVADLAVLYFDDPPDKRAAVVAFSEQQNVDPQLLDALLTALDPATNRILQPVSLATMFSTVPRAGSRGETNGRGTPLARALTPTVGSNLSEFATDLHSTESDLGSYRQMVTADNPRPAEFERRMLVAGSADFSASDRTAALDATRQAIRAEVGKVQAPPRQTINFTARDGVVSLTLRNTTTYPVKVTLRLQGDKLEFPGHENGLVDLTLTDETTRVSLNVRTRASGDSPLDVTVTAPDGHLVVGRTRVTVRSTAFSGVGIILSVGAGTFLAVWWLRHVVAVRRERRKRLRHAVKPAP